MVEDKGIGEVEKESAAGGAATTTNNNNNEVGKKKQRGLLSRVWKGIFRLHGDDFEKRLQYISKEEAAVLNRTKRRSRTWRRMTRNLIIFSVILEVVAVSYAIMTTRSMDLNWKMRAFSVLPMFLLPGLSFVAYSAFISFIRMCELLKLHFQLDFLKFVCSMLIVHAKIFVFIIHLSFNTLWPQGTSLCLIRLYGTPLLQVILGLFIFPMPKVMLPFLLPQQGN